jgi:hypothetical protein
MKLTRMYGAIITNDEGVTTEASADDPKFLVAWVERMGPQEVQYVQRWTLDVKTPWREWAP